MKPSPFVVIMVLLLLIGKAAAQKTFSDTVVIKTPTFLRLYPIELLSSAREFRTGLEFGITPRQSFVIDGSFFKKDLQNSGPGWAMRIDYRFYNQNTNHHSRLFVGPNFMLKKHRYAEWEYVGFRNYRNRDEMRTVATFNLKAGYDFRLFRGGRARYELFTGIGIRYQSNMTDIALFGFDSGSTYTGKSGYLPNFLGGLALKL